MLVGKPAFAAGTVAEIHGAILTSDPDWQSLPQAAPAAVRFLLNRCLQKDRARRMRDIADARFQIEEALNEPAVRVARRKALFHRDAGNRIMNVPVALTASSVEPGIPVALFALSLGAAYHVSPDGQQFLIDEITKEASPITILLN
jgi:hypothetical protein